jgi:predicted nucleic acid-binding protein
MFLLDTNVLSELRRPERADPNVVRWANSVPVDQFFISVMSLFEIERGTLLIARRDPVQARVLRSWVDDHIRVRFADRILPVDEAVALQCARQHVPDPRPERDALIAATALVHGMTVVTRNVEDFAGTGATLLNPWEAKE